MITQGKKSYHNSQVSVSSQMSPVEGRASSTLVQPVLRPPSSEKCSPSPGCRCWSSRWSGENRLKTRTWRKSTNAGRNTRTSGGCSWWLHCRNPTRTAVSGLSSMSTTPSRRRFEPRARCWRRCRKRWGSSSFLLHIPIFYVTGFRAVGLENDSSCVNISYTTWFAWGFMKSQMQQPSGGDLSFWSPNPTSFKGSVCDTWLEEDVLGWEGMRLPLLTYGSAAAPTILSTLSGGRSKTWK